MIAGSGECAEMNETITDEERTKWIEACSWLNVKADYSTSGTQKNFARVIRNGMVAKDAELTALRAQVTMLEAEIEVDNKLLLSRDNLLKSIPECPEHGDQCIPHAMEWVEKMKALESASAPDSEST